MKRPLFILGTRPEAIKLAPLILEFKKRCLSPFIISTGQHRELLPKAFSTFSIKVDLDLKLMNDNQDPIDFLKKTQDALFKLVKDIPTSYLIVHGDTASTLAAAKVAHQFDLPLGHVEAGVRSHNLDEPWPEEGFRREITTLATHHFTPTTTTLNNLLEEQVVAKNILLCGNTIVDAIEFLPKSEHKKRETKILLSIHRRENILNFSKKMRSLLTHVMETFSEFEFIAIQHPNPDARALLDSISDRPNLRLVSPMDYPEVIELLRTCALVLSDSGGFQEEAAVLETPVVVLRAFTDRPESIGQGAFLAGRDKDVCVEAMHQALAYSFSSGAPYGKPGASKKITDFVEAFLRTKK